MIKKQNIVTVLFATLLATAGFAVQEDAEEKWTSLFDGKTLDGWHNPYKWGEAKVVDGEIHLTTNDAKFFLITDKTYDDFIFEAEVKLPPEGKSNSGFMFRAQVDKSKDGGAGTVTGYQAEVDPTSRGWSGGLYDEGRRAWFICPKKKSRGSIAEFRKRAGDCYKHGEWNKYRIECRGKNIKISVNGVLTTDCSDDMDASGVFGLQHHGEKGQTYCFRNIRIQEIKKEKAEKNK